MTSGLNPKYEPFRGLTGVVNITDLELLAAPDYRHLNGFVLFCGDPITSLEGLRHLPSSLRRLGLGAVWKRTSPKPLLRFEELVDLEVHATSGLLSDTEAIFELRQLLRLDVRGLKPFDLAGLPRLGRLERLQIVDGRVEGDFEVLAQLTCLSHLALAYTRNVRDLHGVGAAASLQVMRLESLSSLEVLPDLSGAASLRHVSIENCRKLKDLAPLLTAPNLQAVSCINMPNLEPDDVRVLRKHGTLRAVSVGTGAARRDATMREAHGFPPVDPATGLPASER